MPVPPGEKVTGLREEINPLHILCTRPTLADEELAVFNEVVTRYTYLPR